MSTSEKKYNEIFLPMRLQPVHTGHMTLIKKASELSEKVIILICDLNGRNFNDPFDLQQRDSMLRGSLIDAGISNYHICHLPYFQNNNDRYEHTLKVSGINPKKNRCSVWKFLYSTKIFSGRVYYS